MYKMSINPTIQFRTRLISHENLLQVTIIFLSGILFLGITQSNHPALGLQLSCPLTLESQRSCNSPCKDNGKLTWREIKKKIVWIDWSTLCTLNIFHNQNIVSGCQPYRRISSYFPIVIVVYVTFCRLQNPNFNVSRIFPAFFRQYNPILHSDTGLYPFSLHGSSIRLCTLM
jgi:hypothetical protein